MSVALLGPHGLNQGGFSGISERQSSAALFKGPQAPLQSRPRQPRRATFSPRMWGACFSVRLAENTGFTEKHLAARMDALLLLRSRALCQCSGAARRPRQRCQSESALHLVLINTACTSLSGYHELTEADVVLMPAGFLHA